MTATALLLLVPLAAPPAAERTFESKPVAAWVADLQSDNFQKQRTAFAVLQKAGPKAKEAVPALTKMLNAKDTRWGFAAEILGAIGPDAKEAVPALIALLPKGEGFHGYTTDRLATAIAQIDGAKPEATRALLLSTAKGTPIYITNSGTLQTYPAQVIPHIVALCADKDANVRVRAATVLGTLKQKPVAKVPMATLYEQAGDAANGAAPALEKLLADDSTDVRLAAAKSLAHIAPERAEKIIAVVIELASNPSAVQKTEIHGADIFMPIPEPAAKALLPLLDHKSDRVRMWAINTLSPLPVREPIEDALKNGKTARMREAAAITLGWRFNGTTSLPALKEALADKDLLVRFAAAQGLVRIDRRNGKERVAALPVLIEALQERDELIRMEASIAIRKIGPAAKDAVPAIRKLLDDMRPEVRLEAAITLVVLKVKDANGTVPALTAGLKMGDSAAMRSAKALAELGPDAKNAVPELLKHFDAKSPHVRLYSAEAAARIDPAHAPKSVAVLVAFLKEKKHKSSMIRSYAVVALERIGPPAKDALPTLGELLKDDGPFHADIAMAMIAINPDSNNPAFEWIRKALTTNDFDDAYDLTERLPELGAKAKPLVPDLVKLLKAKSLFLRRGAIQTLAAIGPDAQAALPELQQLAQSDPRADLRKFAAEAVKMIEAK